MGNCNFGDFEKEVLHEPLDICSEMPSEVATSIE